MSDSAHLIQLEGVGRVFGAGEPGGGVAALRDVSLRIGEGEFVCVTGPSGSGKSTLMNILGCLDRPDSGSYRLAGREVGSLGAEALAWLRRRMFGFVFQNYNLLDSISVLENVELPGRYAGTPSGARKVRARELLDGLGLADRAGHMPGELSGGEQQRAAIARALMNGGRIVLADEPTGALDRANGEAVLKALEGLASQGRTVVMISHDEEVAARARRRIDLRDGRVVADTGQASAAAQRPGDAPDMPQADRQGRGLAGGILDTVNAGLSAWRGGMRRGGRSRTVLPALSVLIGVWLGTLPFGVGEGVYQRAMNEVNNNGLDIISVIENPFRGNQDYGNFERLTLFDAENIARVPNVREVSPVRRRKEMLVRRGDIMAKVPLGAMVDLGTKEGRAPSGNRIDMGDFVTLQEDADRERVAVLGSGAYRDLFPEGGNPIGEEISIKGVSFLVKGVLKHRTNLGIDGSWASEEEKHRAEEANSKWVYVPYHTARAFLLDDDRLNSVRVLVGDVEKIADTASAIKDLGLRLYGHEVYWPDYPQIYLAHALDTGRQLLVALGSLAGVALLAGNLSVVGIMLMSVRARRREIGLRMAVGARRGDILRQFFGEALILSVLGGAAGMLAACASIPVLWLFNAPASFALWHFALPFACALVAAVPFAAIPARRAARMNPAAALSGS